MIESALHQMEKAVDSACDSLAYAAPENRALYWNVLKENLASIIEELGQKISNLESAGSHDEE